MPDQVAVVEAFEDSVDVSLFPDEATVIGNAVEKRRREFTTGRACAREALGALGRPPVSIPKGPRGEPRWPPGVVGSITHCAGYRACAAAESSAMVTIGIDAEPHQRLPDGILAAIAQADELAMVQRLARDAPGVHWDRLLFSAKEAVFKAWFPLTQRWLGFEDAALTLDPDGGSFTARLLVPGPLVGGAQITAFFGRWRVHDGLAATAIALAPAGGEAVHP